MKTMSAKEYRKQFVEPALEAEGGVSQVFTPAPKPRGKMKSTESEHDIQDQILVALGYVKGFFWRENSGRVPIKDKYGTRHFRAGIKGVCDILGVYKGRFIGIEVKRPKTKKNISIHQMAFMETVKANGGVAFVCFDPTTVVEQLENEMLKNIK